MAYFSDAKGYIEDTFYMGPCFWDMLKTKVSADKLTIISDSYGMCPVELKSLWQENNYIEGKAWLALSSQWACFGEKTSLGVILQARGKCIHMFIRARRKC